MEEKEGQAEKPKKRQFSQVNLNKKREASKTFRRWKKLTVVQYLIMAGKIQGKSDAEIAKQLDCHTATVARERKKFQGTEWIKEVTTTVLDLWPLFIESLRVNALEANPIVTIAYFKGMGVFKDKQEVAITVDKKTQQEKFKRQIEGTLGIEAKKQLAEAGIDPEKEVKKEE